ncbi:MarR family transcriptional regulator [Ancylobacter sp. FA202]|uniref:MarR family transcriptional regulator n=1 Tax=Ancylobacter sp. FA202 TaxID=1111106 RepID=UPI000372B0B8|nr:MarR family transcriptional regulator [Ancylobacter sp. FA202]
MQKAGACMSGESGPAASFPEPVLRLFGAKAINDLMAAPGFPAAVEAAAANAVRLYDGSWIRNRLLNDRGRLLAVLLILDLHFTESGGRGVTGARLRREVVELDVCSAGRATAFLAALRFKRLLADCPVSGPKERRLMPTAALLQTHRERWNGMFAAIAHVDAPAAEAARALPDELLFGPCTHAMAACFRQGLRVFAAAPELQDLAERDAGLVMLVSLIARDGPVSVSQLARQFHISRAHATNVLQRAEARGLACSAPGLSGYRASPALQPVLARFYAVIFLTFLTALREGRPSGG